MEPKETYFETYVITAQTAAIIKPTCQLSARIVPTPDATDLPPVNFKNIDLLCPIITATAASTGSKPIDTKDVAKSLVSTTGKAPFIASRIITVKNHFLPMTRFTLVAPVDPEPIVLIS